jgi:Flp pilus assembly protein TadD
LRKDYGTAWAYLTAVCGLEGKTSAGIEAGQKATQLQPDLPEAWSNLAAIYIAMRQFDKAEETLEGLQRIGTPKAHEMAANLRQWLERKRVETR